jgi:site-specific recombinase XerD
MVEQDIPFYNSDVGKEYLEHRISQKELAESTKRFFRTTIRRLNDCYFGKGYTKSVPRKNLSTPGGFQRHVDDYLALCNSIGNSKTTLKMKERACHEFCTNLYEHGYKHFSSIDAGIVCKAILGIKNQEYLSCIKNLLSHLGRTGITIRDFSLLVPKHRRREKLPSIYHPEEVYLLEQAVNKTALAGKRDFAIILLVTRLGIRAGDVANLRFENLDIENGRIKFTQHKTKVPTNLPLLPEIENALIDYINSERPESNQKNFFLSSIAPYDKISYSVVSFTIKKHMQLSGIENNDRKRGPHSLRSSLATSLVNDNVNYNVVRRILGHESPNAIKHYAKLDVEMLRLCALEIPYATGGFRQFLEGRRQDES